MMYSFVIFWSWPEAMGGEYDEVGYAYGSGTGIGGQMVVEQV